jgi:tetratricopeptide (TPR) repeat protein
MECARRVTHPRSIEILRHGMFCCEPLPDDVTTMPAARRFYLLKAQEMDPLSPDPPMLVGKTLWEEGLYKEAIPCFQSARKLSSEPLSAVIGLFTMHRLLGHWEEARGLVEWVRGQKGVDAAKVADYLEAKLLCGEERYQEAIPPLERAIARAGSSGDGLGGTPYTMVDARLYLALARLKTGDPYGADEDFKRYLKKMNDPEFRLYYNHCRETFRGDQGGFFELVESSWARTRQ